MRLINTNTGEFESFWDTQRPQYGILSHTWGDEEVSYLDYLFITSNLPGTSAGLVHALLKPPRADSEGIRKIQNCCKLARSRGVDWVWVDTCCIDQSSSAEISEAINSMWAWYRDATECYVYLGDVSVRPQRDVAADDFDEASREQFRSARWFGRGWTLQELLAPTKELFCNNRWEVIAEKSVIGEELSKITKIPLVFLDGTVSPSDNKLCSIAMRMSWVSRRQTTRIEDMAYCMLGLFDVHMPLIYGEGRKAFMRLQLEILKKSDDDSIYAWKAPLDRSGLLATWPTAFAESDNIIQIVFPDDPTPWIPPMMTSIGLEMRGRYERDDPYQTSVDVRHGVHTIHTSISTGGRVSLVMYCGPKKEWQPPTTHSSKDKDLVVALVLDLRRIGSTWQRVNCRKLQFTQYIMAKPTRVEAYNVFYVAQQGL
ncbi:hypothetical protein LTR67_005388 [Exophiala xenobiotica]